MSFVIPLFAMGSYPPLPPPPTPPPPPARSLLLCSLRGLLERPGRPGGLSAGEANHKWRRGGTGVARFSGLMPVVGTLPGSWRRAQDLICQILALGFLFFLTSVLLWLELGVQRTAIVSPNKDSNGIFEMRAIALLSRAWWRGRRARRRVFLRRCSRPALAAGRGKEEGADKQRVVLCIDGKLCLVPVSRSRSRVLGRVSLQYAGGCSCGATASSLSSR
jgi:hypothetical protein